MKCAIGQRVQPPVSEARLYIKVLVMIDIFVSIAVGDLTKRKL